MLNVAAALSVLPSFHNGLTGKMTGWKSGIGASMMQNQHRPVTELLQAGVLTVELYDDKRSAHSPSSSIGLTVDKYSTIQEAISELAKTQKHFFLELYFDKAMKRDEVVERQGGRYVVKQQIYDSIIGNEAKLEELNIKHIRVTKDNIFTNFGSMVKALGDKYSYVWTWSESYKAEDHVKLDDLEDPVNDINEETSYRAMKVLGVKSGSEVTEKVMKLAKKMHKTHKIGVKDPFKETFMQNCQNYLYNLYRTPSIKEFLFNTDVNAKEDGKTLEALTNGTFFDDMFDFVNKNVDETWLYIKKNVDSVQSMLVGHKDGKWVNPRILQASFKVNNYNSVHEKKHTEFMTKRTKMLHETKFKGIKIVKADGEIEIILADSHAEAMKEMERRKISDQNEKARRLYEAEAKSGSWVTPSPKKTAKRRNKQPTTAASPIVTENPYLVLEGKNE
jgi:hypothetical protein